jgi:hypothetical protein
MLSRAFIPDERLPWPRLCKAVRRLPGQPVPSMRGAGGREWSFRGTRASAHFQQKTTKIGRASPGRHANTLHSAGAARGDRPQGGSHGSGALFNQSGADADGWNFPRHPLRVTSVRFAHQRADRAASIHHRRSHQVFHRECGREGCPGLQTDRLACISRFHLKMRPPVTSGSD